MDTEVLREGVLKKKKSRVNTWADRYFKLKHNCLEYYVKANETEPKGVFPLTHNCQVSKISSDVGKKRKQFLFKVSCRIDDETDEKEDKEGVAPPEQSPDKKESSKKKVGGDGVGAKVAAAAVGGVVVGALTSGIGLLAGMMVVGMGGAAAGGAVAMSAGNGGKERSLILACNTYEEADSWVNAIENQILELGDSVFGVSAVPQRRLTTRGNRSAPHPEVRIDEVEDWLHSTRWKACDTYAGLRLFEPNYDDDQCSYDAFFNPIQAKQVDVQAPPCLRVNVDVNTTPADAFAAIMLFGTALKTGIVQSVRIIENIDNNTDIIHLKMNPMFLFPTWIAPRDFCMLRYWRDNSDGSYILCFDSTNHVECPVLEDYVRAEFHGVYVIAPPKGKSHNNHHKDNDEEEVSECLISLIAQVDPKGWIWNNFGYKHAFLREIMLQVLDLKDALESDRFLQAHFDPVEPPPSLTPVASTEGVAAATTEVVGTIASIPPPILSPSMWQESNASTFKVRSGTYNTDKVKCASGPAVFKLIGIDFYEVPEATHNIASHPKNRVNLAYQRGDPAWVFVVNIMVPGPPYLSFVIYFQGDKSVIDADTPFGRVARPFFYGNDDDFRNNRFKIIPKILDGNLIIKMAVKDTPALLGNKLKQYYYKGDNYFELDVDVGSSSVARNVVGLAMGYSKAIVVDMGFCLQGNEEDELPEVLMGGCTCIHVDAATAKKL